MRNNSHFYLQKITSFAGMWFVALIVIGLYSGYLAIQWVLEAVKNFAFASEPGLGELPFIGPAMYALFAGTITLTCAVILFVIIGNWRIEQQKNQNDEDTRHTV